MKNRKLWVSILAGILAFIMVASLIVGVLPGAADAASLSELEKQLAQLEAQKKEIDSQISGLRSQLSDNLDSMEKIIAQKNTIDQEIFMLYEQTNNLNEQIATYSLLIADTQDKLDEAQARLKQLNEENKERIRAMEEDGNLSYWSVLFKANDFADLLDRLNMIEEIAASDQRRLNEMSDVAKEVAETKAAMEAEVAALEASKAELAESQKQQEEKRAEADKLLAELIATGDEYEALLAEAEHQAGKLSDKIDGVEDDIEAKEYEQWLATSKPSSSGSSSSSSSGDYYVASDATWLTPCYYVRMTSPFGWRIHPIYGDWRFHYGIDLAGPQGTPIYATRAGTVTRTTYDSSSGHYVVLNHGDGFESKYLHMTHYIVSPGEYVSAGQVIGYMGSTGASTGSHLHFSIMYNGQHVNPAKYIGV